MVGFDGPGHAIVSVDNTGSLRAFGAWSACFFGKASRGALHGVRIAPRPATMLAATAPRHPPGARLLVLRDGALLDMGVKARLGPAHGCGHLLEVRTYPNPEPNPDPDPDPNPDPNPNPNPDLVLDGAEMHRHPHGDA